MPRGDRAFRACMDRAACALFPWQVELSPHAAAFASRGARTRRPPTHGGQTASPPRSPGSAATSPHPLGQPRPTPPAEADALWAQTSGAGNGKDGSHPVPRPPTSGWRLTRRGTNLRSSLTTVHPHASRPPARAPLHPAADAAVARHHAWRGRGEAEREPAGAGGLRARAAPGADDGGRGRDEKGAGRSGRGRASGGRARVSARRPGSTWRPPPAKG